MNTATTTPEVTVTATEVSPEIVTDAATGTVTDTTQEVIQAQGLGDQAAGQAAQPFPQTDRGHSFAITSFVLGIVSVVSGWTFLAPIAGLVFGIIALRRRTAERTLALWGVWLNGAMLALTVLAVFAFIVIVGAGVFFLPFVEG